MKQLRLNYLLILLIQIAWVKDADAQYLGDQVEDAFYGQDVQEYSAFYPLDTENPDFDFNAELEEYILLNYVRPVKSQIMRDKPALLRLIIPINEQFFLHVKLIRVATLTSNFIEGKLFGDHQVENLETNHGVHYQGVVDGQENSVAAFSFFEEEIMGMVSNNQGNFVIGKVSDDINQTYIVYNDRDFISAVENQFKCSTLDVKKKGQKHPVNKAGGIYEDRNCVRIYIEADYSLYLEKSSDYNATKNYVIGFFNQAASIFQSDGIIIKLSELKIWTTSSGYDFADSHTALNDFRTAVGGFSWTGDLAHLVSVNFGNGGAAYTDVLCNSSSTYNYNVAYSDVDPSFNNVPTYSWTVNVFAHEIGHNLGSSHTHDCVWNGNNTQIDDCSYIYDSTNPPSCFDPSNPVNPPTWGGSLMSYCHLLSFGIVMGFHWQVSAVMRGNVYYSQCLIPCCPDDLNLSGPVNSTKIELGKNIYSNEDISSTVGPPGVTYDGTYILLQNGFRANSGCYFKAAWIDCHSHQNVARAGIKSIDSRDLNSDEPLEDIEVFPNPSTGIFSFTGLRIGDQLTIFNSHGQAISTDIVKDSNLYRFCVQGSNGVYLAIIQRESELRNIKLVKY